MPRIDCNAFLGAYPWRKVPGTSADALLKALARTKIDAAWVTHLPSLFWRDPTEGNAWLYATTREDRRFKPVPAVHPGLAQWEQVLFGSTPAEARRIWWDISWIWGPPEDHLALLLDTIGAERFVFGTGQPLRLPEASVAKLDLLELAPERRAAIESRNVQELVS